MAWYYERFTASSSLSSLCHRLCKRTQLGVTPFVDTWMVCVVCDNISNEPTHTKNHPNSEILKMQFILNHETGDIAGSSNQQQNLPDDINSNFENQAQIIVLNSCTALLLKT